MKEPLLLVPPPPAPAPLVSNVPREPVIQTDSGASACGLGGGAEKTGSDCGPNDTKLNGMPAAAGVIPLLTVDEISPNPSLSAMRCDASTAPLPIALKTIPLSFK